MLISHVHVACHGAHHENVRTHVSLHCAHASRAARVPKGQDDTSRQAHFVLQFEWGGGDVTSRNKRRHRIITRFPPRGSYARAIAQSCRRRGGGVHGARQADSEMLLELSIPVRVRLQCLRLELTPITQQAALSVANPMTACHRRRCRMALPD